MPREAKFPLPISVGWGEGGKLRFPSNVAGLGTHSGSPAELPQINIPRGEGTDLLLSKISKLCASSEKTGRI